MTERQDLNTATSRSQGRRGFSRLVWWVAFGIPALIFVVGAGLLVEAAIFMGEAESARGRVIDVRADHDGDGVSYTPLIRYRRNDGRAFEAETHMASSGYDYDVGARVDVLYSRANPAVVRIDSFFSLYGPGLIFAVVGGVFIVILTLVRKKMSRRSGSAPERLEEEARAKLWQAVDSVAETRRGSEPRTTDPSQYGHVHEPKPKREPTVRRMR